MNGHQYHHTFNGKLVEIRHTQQVHTVIDHSDGQSANQRSQDRAITAAWTRTAEHRSRNRIQLRTYPGFSCAE